MLSVPWWVWVVPVLIAAYITCAEHARKHHATGPAAPSPKDEARAQADEADARRDLITTAAAAWMTPCTYCGTSNPAGDRCMNCGAPATP